jgi:hypothetical protein
MTTQTVPTDSYSPHPEGSTYGLHARLCRQGHAWRMDGIYGRLSVIFPAYGACVTVTSHYEGPTIDILRPIRSELIPGLVR